MNRSEPTLSRRDLVGGGAALVGTLSGVSLLTPLVEAAQAAVVGEGDVASARFLLPFEYLQVTFYGRALKGPHVGTGPLKSLFERVLDQERQHAETLTKIVEELGGEPPHKIPYTFTYKNRSELLLRAESLEQTAASAYNGVIPLLGSQELREKLASIAQIEARHSAAILMEGAKAPAATALEPPYRPLQALESVEKFTGPAIYEQTG